MRRVSKKTEPVEVMVAIDPDTGCGDSANDSNTPGTQGYDCANTPDTQGYDSANAHAAWFKKYPA